MLMAYANVLAFFLLFACVIVSIVGGCMALFFLFFHDRIVFAYWNVAIVYYSVVTRTKVRTDEETTQYLINSL